MENKNINNSIKISIIIATYNTGKYIQECLDSVFSQSIKPIEIIVINDGSTDNTASILHSYEKQYEYMRVIHQENVGQGKSINRALDLAQGEFIAFMDPDDKYPTNNCLEMLYNAANENCALMCGGNILLNDNGVISMGYMAGDGDEKNSKNCFIDAYDYYYLYGHTRFIYNTCMIRENGIKHGEYRRYGDQILTLGALCAAGKIFELDFPVYEYRINHYCDNFDEDVWFDIVNAFRDTIIFMIEHNMEKMYKINAYREYSEWVKIIYKWTKRSCRWDGLIDSIHKIMDESTWSTQQELFRSIILRVETETKHLVKLLEDTPVVIYGAGENTKILIENYGNRIAHLVGIAVTESVSDVNIAGIKIKKIVDYLDYKDDAIIIVTPSGVTGIEMEKYALRLGFKSVQRIDMKFIANNI